MKKAIEYFHLKSNWLSWVVAAGLVPLILFYFKVHFDHKSVIWFCAGLCILAIARFGHPITGVKVLESFFWRSVLRWFCVGALILIVVAVVLGLFVDPTHWQRLFEVARIHGWVSFDRIQQLNEALDSGNVVKWAATGLFRFAGYASVLGFLIICSLGVGAFLRRCVASFSGVHAQVRVWLALDFVLGIALISAVSNWLFFLSVNLMLSNAILIGFVATGFGYFLKARVKYVRGAVRTLIEHLHTQSIAILAFYAVFALLSLSVLGGAMAMPGFSDEMAYHLSDADVFARSNSLLPPVYATAYLPNFMSGIMAFLRRFVPIYVAKASHSLFWFALIVTGLSLFRSSLARVLWLIACAVSPLVLLETNFGLTDIAMSSLYALLFVTAKNIIGFVREKESNENSSQIAFEMMIWSILAATIVITKYSGTIFIFSTLPAVIWGSLKLPRRLVGRIGVFAGIASLWISAPWFLRNAIYYGSPFFPLVFKGSPYSTELQCLIDYYKVSFNFRYFFNYWASLFAWPTRNDTGVPFTPALFSTALAIVAIFISKAVRRGIEFKAKLVELFDSGAILTSIFLLFNAIVTDRYMTPVFFASSLVIFFEVDRVMSPDGENGLQIMNTFLPIFGIAAISFSTQFSQGKAVISALTMLADNRPYLKVLFSRSPLAREYDEMRTITGGETIFGVSGFNHYYYQNYIATFPNQFYVEGATSEQLAESISSLGSKYLIFDPNYHDRVVYHDAICSRGLAYYKNFVSSDQVVLIKKWPSGNALYRLNRP